MMTLSDDLLVVELGYCTAAVPGNWYEYKIRSKTTWNYSYDSFQLQAAKGSETGHCCGCYALPVTPTLAHRLKGCDPSRFG